MFNSGGTFGFGQPQQPNFSSGGTFFNTPAAQQTPMGFGTSTFGSTPASTFQMGSTPNPCSNSMSTTSLGTGIGNNPTTGTSSPMGGFFGATQPTGGLFGTQPAQNTGGLFGAKPAFSATPQSTFGSPAASTPTFGSPSPFGMTTTSTFGAAQEPGTISVKYQPTSITEQPGSSPNYFQAITAMKQYENKSFEELRFEDYMANRKGTTATPQSTFGSTFGASTSASPFGGSTFGQTPAGGLFGQTNPTQPQQPGGLFGQTSTGMFGAQPQQQPGGLFGQTSTTGGLFGTQPQQQSSTFSFGATQQQQQQPQQQQQQQQQQPGGIFGMSQPITTGAFGSTQPASTGLFGQPSTTGFSFGQSSTASPFGQTTTPATSFGAQPQQQTSSFSFGAPQQQPAANPFGSSFGTTQQSAGGLFTSGTSNTGSLFQTPQTQSPFGATNANTFAYGSNTPKPATNASSPLFGSNNTLGGLSTPGNTFGTSTFGSQTPSQQGSLFKPSTFSAASPSSPATFGGLNTSGTGLFTSNPQSTTPSLGLGSFNFSSPTTNTALNIGGGNSSLGGLGGLGGTSSGLGGFGYGAGLNSGFQGAQSNLGMSGQMPQKPQTPQDSSPYASNRLYSDEYQIPAEIENNQTSQIPFEPKTDKLEKKKTVTPTHSSVMKSGATIRPRSSPKTVQTTPDYSEHSPHRELGRKSLKQLEIDENEEIVATAPGSRAYSPLQKDETPTRIPQKVTKQKNQLRLDEPMYSTEPPLSELQLFSVDELKKVRNFKIIHSEYGSIEFNEADLSEESDLNKTVIFHEKTVTVYPEADRKPPVGLGLNRRAIIKLHKCYPKNERGEPITDPEDSKVKRKFQKIKETPDTKFIDYDYGNGTWTFQVEHFSSYEVPSDDEQEQESTKVKKAKIVNDSEMETEEPEIFFQHTLAGGSKPSQPPASPTKSFVLMRNPSANSTFYFNATQSNPSSQPTQTFSTKSSRPASNSFSHNPSTFSNNIGSLALALVPMQTETSSSSSTPSPINGHLSVIAPGSAGLIKTKVSTIVDAGLGMNYSFRTGWALGGKIIRIEGSSIKIHSIEPLSLPQNEPLATERLLYNDALDKTLSLTLKNSVTQTENGVPKISTPPIAFREFQQKFADYNSLKGIDDKKPTMRSLLCKERQMWNLASILWDAGNQQFAPLASKIGEDGKIGIESIFDPKSTPERDALLEQQNRKDLLSKWLQALITPKIEESLSHEVLSDERSIFHYLTGRQIVKAVESAERIRDFRLSTVIAQGANDLNTRDLIREQMHIWTDLEFDGYISLVNKKIFAILSGEIDHVVCKSLEWYRAYGVHLWYATRFAEPIAASVFRFNETFASDPNLAPIPSYLEQNQNQKQIYDIFYNLLMIYSSDSHLLEQSIQPLSFGPAKNDYRLTWLLAKLLRARNTRQLSDVSKIDKLHLSFCEQLEAGNQSKWGAFALLHLSQPEHRKSALKNFLFRYYSKPDRVAGPENSSDSFFLNLGIPKSWIAEAKARYYFSLGNKSKAVEKYCEAGLLDEAYLIFMNDLAPNYIISENLEDLEKILVKLHENKDIIHNWSSLAQAYFDYLLLENAKEKEGQKRLAHSLSVFIFNFSSHNHNLQTRVAIELINEVITKVLHQDQDELWNADLS